MPSMGALTVVAKSRAVAPGDGRQRVFLRRRAERAGEREPGATTRTRSAVPPDQARPRCPECTAIMDWRSAHRWIAITNRAEIRLSDNPLGDRHLHTRDLRVAHRKNRVPLQRTQTEGKELFHRMA